VTTRGGKLRFALALTVGVALLELAGGFVSGSLALLSDAAHVFMDAFALGIALAASIQATRPATQRHTFGYARVEVLAALANGALLFA
jgi:cobalt-zinc-cadmium efflux system protein